MKFNIQTMNRLIIIGNGFDLAHGLPTGYGDFIDWYWNEIIDTNHNDDLVHFESEEKIIFETGSNLKAIISHLQSVNPKKNIIRDKEGYYFTERQYSNGNTFDFQIYIVKFKNKFFSAINEKKNVQTWVDIENEYYKLLKDCLEENDNSKVKKLNEEFGEVKRLLEQYLFENVASKYNFDNSVDMQKTINIFNLKKRLMNEEGFVSEFPDSEQRHIKKWISDYKVQWKIIVANGTPHATNLFLNFNYTPTVDNYSSIMNDNHRDDYGRSEVIQIHGKLNDSSNPINFGFGDEMDDDYKLIERKDDNEYLRNIKSFQYLQTSNYKKMLGFMESESFQVYVMGHSCGLSDRILLNKIFEHNNCKSIKVFYYKNGDWDNYTDIVQNISRHFNKKEMMRERIVNKTLCEPLPQIQLPLKQ